MRLRRRVVAAVHGAALVVVAGALVLASARAADAKPAFDASVVDEAGAVPDDAQRALAATLDDYRARGGKQIAVAVVQTTGNEALENYAIDLARQWGVGDQGEDDGVLLLVVVGDRKARIEVGRGVEGDLTDSESGRIIRDYVVPNMQASNIVGALVTATEAIRSELGDETVTPPPPPEDDGGSSTPWTTLIPLGLVGLGLGVAAFGSGAGGRGRRGGLGGRGMGGAPIIWGGGGFGGYGGFGGGGGGGGGFGGGGGGGFGGGGASGGW